MGLSIVFGGRGVVRKGVRIGPENDHTGPDKFSRLDVLRFRACKSGFSGVGWYVKEYASEARTTTPAATICDPYPYVDVICVEGLRFRV